SPLPLPLPPRPVLFPYTTLFRSSETGPQHGMPMNGPYAMSKHAVEAYADSLRRELMFLGIDVVLVQPGPFRTGMTASIRRRFSEDRKSTRLNSSHVSISYAVFCL